MSESYGLRCKVEATDIVASILQIVFLVLELGTFISGVLFGFCQLCRLRPQKPEKISDMAHRLRVSLLMNHMRVIHEQPAYNLCIHAKACETLAPW